MHSERMTQRICLPVIFHCAVLVFGFHCEAGCLTQHDTAASCYYERVIPRLGRIYVSDQKMCFRSTLISQKIVVPLADIISVKTTKATMAGLPHQSICVKMKDQQEVGRLFMVLNEMPS
jgi:hypothetical protein